MKPSAGSLLRLGLCALVLALHAVGMGAPPKHPLDPLSKEELALAVKTLRDAGKTTPESRFSTLVLKEPPKAEVLAFKAGEPFRREAFAVIYERAGHKVFEAVVDLAGGKVAAWKEVPGVEPPFLLEEFVMTQEVTRADPRWQAAMEVRGINDFKTVQVDAWSAGAFGIEELEGKRVAAGVSYLRGDSKNPYARPIDGVVAYVDLNAGKVIKFVDAGMPPIPKAARNLDEASQGRLREKLKPLKIEQPEGPSFKVDGHEIRWDNWRFRYSMHPREGVVIHEVTYEDQGKSRSVLYRGSLAEMVVPYGDPAAGWFFRNAFDEGEYGVGRIANPLEPLNDAPANAVFFDALFADDTGSPMELPKGVMLYERDGGVLWKHVDYVTRENESRRARELVLGYITTAGNYEYGFNWVFHQDGVLEMELTLTGIMAARGIDVRPAQGMIHDGVSHGHVVDENVEAVHHQHFMNFRLDLDVDGAAANSVLEMNTVSVPEGEDNPRMNAMTMRETLLRREQEAKREMSLATSRKWRVINSSVRNIYGQAVGYTLFPGENSVPYALPGASIRKRAGFLDAHLWVTPFEASEMNSAGHYINLSKGGEGLPKWTRANRSIENQDVVLWYTMGTTHIPRPEDWPVMPSHKMGFKLVPTGFFARNPAMDVPKER